MPSVKGPSNLTKVSSIWPGIGTGNSAGNSLVQAGTEQDGACGQPGCFTQTISYYYWLEIYPQQSQQEITNLTAKPGDAAGVEVDFNAVNDQATFLVCDYTQNSCVSGNEYVNAGGSSGAQAEWIVERTEACGVSCTYPSLNNFGDEQITDAADFVNGAGRYLYNVPSVAALYMVSCNGGKTTLASPTPATSANPGVFYVQWDNYGTSNNPKTCNP